MKCLEPIHGAQQVCVERGHGSVVDILDKDLVDQLLRAGRDLAPAAQREGLCRHRLEAPPVTIDGVAQASQVKGHRLQATLEHQGARHAGVVFEVPVEIPALGIDLHDGLEGSSSPGPAAYVKIADRAEQQHRAVLDTRGAGMGQGQLEAIAKAVHGATI